MAETEITFTPSRVEGLPRVTQVTVFSDRIELETAGGKVVHRFVDIARWPRPALLWKWLYRLGWKRRWLPVADRD